MIRRLVAHLAHRADLAAGKALERQGDSLVEHMRALREEDDAMLRARFAQMRGMQDSDAPRAVACVAEGVRRALGLPPRRAQLTAALLLVRGDVVELATGEGKTLALVIAALVCTRRGESVHVLTQNGYLAARDAATARAVGAFFDVSVGLVTRGATAGRKRLAYRKAITYASADVVAFDSMRDARASRDERPFIREFGVALIDEIDSMLVDAASRPLVLGSGAELSAYAERMCALVGKLVPEIDFVVDTRGSSVAFTERGYDTLETALRACGLLACALFEAENGELVAAAQVALEARTLYHADQHYLVREGCVWPLDATTGRAHRRRRFGHGLQAAIEAKEGVPVRPSSSSGDVCTYGAFVARYRTFAGATATLDGLDEELLETFDKHIARVPSDAPCVRIDAPDRFFLTHAASLEATVCDVMSAHAVRQPVLVVTTTEQTAGVIASMLEARGLAARRLTAKNPEQEAAIIAEAAVPSAITVATQVAGRGTDIALGGSAASPCDVDFVRRAGGLLVVGVEHQRAARIDAQLRGRAGRRGAPGRSVFFVSLEDDLVRAYGTEPMREALRKALFAKDAHAVALRGRELVEDAMSRAASAASQTRRLDALHDRRRVREGRAMASLRRRLRGGAVRETSAAPLLARAPIERRVTALVHRHIAHTRALQATCADTPRFETLDIRPRRLTHTIAVRLGVDIEPLPQHDSVEALIATLTSHVHAVLEDRLRWALELAGKKRRAFVLDHVRRGRPWLPLLAFRARYLEVLEVRYRAHVAITEDEEASLSLSSFAERHPERVLDRRVHERFQALLHEAAEQALKALLEARPR